MTSKESAAIRRDLDLIGRSESVAGLGDADLLARFVGRRDAAAEAAFEAIVLRHGPMVRGVCRSQLADPGEADDAFQATFLILIRKAGLIRVGESLGPWLYGVAWRVAAKSRAIARKRRGREASAMRVEAVEEADVASGEVRKILLEELGRFPERYRSPVVLCHLEGRTHQEAARHLRCPVGTLSSRLSRARGLLRSRLERRGLGVSAAVLASALGSREALAVPASLVRSVVGMAAAGVVPSTIRALAEATVASLVVGKWKLAALALLTSSALIVGGWSILERIPKARVPARAEGPVEPTRTPTPPIPVPAQAGVEAVAAQVDDRPARESSVAAPVLGGITIDGDLGDWPAAIPRHPIRNLLADDPAFGRLGPGGLEDADLSTSPDLSAAFSVGFDPAKQLVYLAVIVRDDRPVVGHTSHLDTDAVEVYVDGLRGDRSISVAGNEEFENTRLPAFPVQQYVAIPGAGRIYGKRQQTNPILIGGDLERTLTRMAYVRRGDVTTYEWAIQVFDRYPDRPTRLAPGKRIGFDLAVADKDVPAVSSLGYNEPRDDRTAWIYWGAPWRGPKVMNAGGLGEIVLGR